ncbi:MAG: DUF998 domain-containing protein [Pseudonocardiales bacterium]|nr:DUF998 domain-containing protein [Pseudonocardiales bacterium]
MAELVTIRSEAPQSVTQRLARSYLDLRAGIGAMGTLLPFVLFFGNSILVRRFDFRSSLSSYYYTDMRNVLVGSLCAIGVFLVAYRYEPVDTWASSLAGIAGICVALFPTSPDSAKRIGTVGAVHLVAAVIFFGTLAFFCLCLFTRSNQPKDRQTVRKRLRNRIYRTCGVLIILSIVCAVASKFLPAQDIGVIHPLFWCEVVAILSFGLAWAIKGETISPLRDRTD